MCAAASGSAQPSNATSGSTVAVESTVGSLASATAKTCEIAAEPELDLAGMDAVAGFISTVKIGDTIIEAAGADPGLLGYGLGAFAVAVPFLAPLIGLVIAFLFVSCWIPRALSRRCRRCCGTRKCCRPCCGERASMGRILRKKKISIIVGTVIGVAGMVVMWQVGILAPKGADASLKDGFAAGKNADCAASKFVDYMLAGYVAQTSRRLDRHVDDAADGDLLDTVVSGMMESPFGYDEDATLTERRLANHSNAGNGSQTSPTPAPQPGPTPAPTVATRDTSPLPPAGEFLGLDRAAQTLSYMSQELTSVEQLKSEALLPCICQSHHGHRRST